MLTFLKNILKDNTPEAFVNPRAEKDLQLAACMLLLEAAQIDGTIDPREEMRIQSILQQRFSLAKADSEKLIDRARKTQAESVDLYPVTSLINQHWSTEEKYNLLENVWQIVYADGILDQHEDYLMHKLGNMLHLSHRQLIETKLEAKQNVE